MEARSARHQAPVPPLLSRRPRPLRRPRRLDASRSAARARRQPCRRRRLGPHRPGPRRLLDPAGHHQARVNGQAPEADEGERLLGFRFGAS